MILANPKRLIIIGLFLVIFGFLAPFFILLDMLESTFFLNFLSFGAQIAGLFLGMVGAAMYVKANRARDK